MGVLMWWPGPSAAVNLWNRAEVRVVGAGKGLLHGRLTVGGPGFELALNRLMGMFAVAYEYGAVPAPQREVIEKALETYKRVRRAMRGDRYVLAGPEPLVQPHDFEADNWEAYEFVAREGDLAAVYVFR